MRELIELQTGQVAFISGLMSGFSLSIAAQILRYGIENRRAQAVFIMFTVCSLLFLLALYVDVRLSIEVAGLESVSAEALQQIMFVRNIGTSCATVAVCVFVLAIGSLGWLVSPTTGGLTTALTGLSLFGFWVVWSRINVISSLLPDA